MDVLEKHADVDASKAKPLHDDRVAWGLQPGARLSTDREKWRIFDGLDKQQLEWVIRHSPVKAYRADEWIVREGEAIQDFLVVLEGECMEIHGSKIGSRFAQGQTLGEADYLRFLSHRICVKAHCDCRVLFFSLPLLMALFAEEPAIAMKIHLNLSNILASPIGIMRKHF